VLSHVLERGADSLEDLHERILDVELRMLRR